MSDPTDRYIAILREYFPRLADRLTQSPGLIRHLKQSIPQMLLPTFAQACLQWARQHNVDPTLDQIFYEAEAVETERRRPGGERTSLRRGRGS